MRPGDVALGRLDVLPSVDGVEPGLEALRALEARGVIVLNGPEALMRAHDKLLTAQVLEAAGLPHPETRLAVPGAPLPVVDEPVVLKPRFGSWGREVILCSDRRALAATLQDFHRHPWYPRTGALVQELIPPCGRDLRVLVAGGRVVGAIQRVAAPGEWRTNVALGGHRVAVSEPPADACELALLAAEACDADLVGRRPAATRRRLGDHRAQRCGRLHGRVRHGRRLRTGRRRADGDRRAAARSGFLASYRFGTGSSE